jgi:hypothetical protein
VSAGTNVTVPEIACSEGFTNKTFVVHPPTSANYDSSVAVVETEGSRDEHGHDVIKTSDG